MRLGAQCALQGETEDGAAGMEGGVRRSDKSEYLIYSMFSISRGGPGWGRGGSAWVLGVCGLGLGLVVQV